MLVVVQASLHAAPAAHVIVHGPVPAHDCSQLEPAEQDVVQPFVCEWQSNLALLQRSHVRSHGPLTSQATLQIAPAAHRPSHALLPSAAGHDWLQSQHPEQNVVHSPVALHAGSGDVQTSVQTIPASGVAAGPASEPPPPASPVAAPPSLRAPGPSTKSESKSRPHAPSTTAHATPSIVQARASDMHLQGSTYLASHSAADMLVA